uniref:Uncharacterized protein n=2 Tax=Capitella teleta TaxID=283909 RepID=X2A2E3_CAPTE
MEGNQTAAAAAAASRGEDVDPLWQMMVVQYTDDGESALTVIQEENDDVSCLKISSDEIDVIWNDDEDEDEDEVICHLSPDKTDDHHLSKEDFSFLESNVAAMTQGISPDDEEEPERKMKKKAAPVSESITSSVPLLSYPMGHLPVTAIPPLKASSCGHLA